MKLIYKLTVGTPSLQDLSPNIDFILPRKSIKSSLKFFLMRLLEILKFF